jgi:hypothetical protein
MESLREAIPAAGEVMVITTAGLKVQEEGMTRGRTVRMKGLL